MFFRSSKLFKKKAARQGNRTAFYKGEIYAIAIKKRAILVAYTEILFIETVDFV